MTRLLRIAQTLAWRRPRRRTVGVSFIASAWVASALLAGWVVFYFYPQNSVQLKTVFTPELVDILAMQDSTGQRLAHQVFLALVGAGALLGIVLCGKNFPVLGGRTGAGLAWIEASVRRPPLLLWLAILAYASAASAQPFVAIFGVASVLYLPLLARRNPTAALRFLVVCAIVGYVAYAVLPGFAGPLQLYRPAEKVPVIGWHYNAVVGGAADRIAAGGKIFRDVTPSYGLLVATLLAAIQKHFGMLDFGGHVRVVQAAQVVFLLTAVAAHGFWARGRLVQMLIALTLFVPWFTTYYYFIWFPNLTAIRSLGFPLACLVLVMLRRIPTPRDAVGIGALCALALLINLETGIAITAGALVFLWSGIERDFWRTLPGSAARVLAGGVLAVIAFIVAYRVGIGEWPISRYWGAIFEAITLSRQGFGGHASGVDPLALWILVHSAYLVVRGAITWRVRGLSHSRRVSVAIAVMILIWFAYYANRPYRPNLQLYLFLYSFLLYDVFTPVFRLIRVRRPVRPVTAVLALLIGFIVLPPVYEQQIQTWGQKRVFMPRAGNTTELSGIYVDREVAEELTTQASFLSSHRGEKVVSFSANSYLLSLLTGIYGPLRVMDPFYSTITPGHFDMLVKQTLHMKPAMVLFDARGNLLAGRMQQRRFFRRLKLNISAAYRKDYQSSGWEVWTRRRHVRARRVAVATTVQSFH